MNNNTTVFFLAPSQLLCLGDVCSWLPTFPPFDDLPAPEPQLCFFTAFTLPSEMFVFLQGSPWFPFCLYLIWVCLFWVLCKVLPWMRHPHKFMGSGLRKNRMPVMLDLRLLPSLCHLQGDRPSCSQSFAKNRCFGDIP